MSLLSDEEDDEEEDKPLAARMAIKTGPEGSRKTTSKMTSGKRCGKKASSMKSKAQTAPAATQIPTGREQAELNGQANGVNGHETQIKVEEKMDEGQLNRLATGVTVDTGGTASTAVRNINLAPNCDFIQVLAAFCQNRKGRCYRVAQGHYTNNLSGK